VHCRLRLLIFHLYTKYDANILLDAQIMAPEMKFDIAATVIFNLFLMATFIHTSYFALQTSTSVQDFTPISYYNCLKFKTAGVGHVGFSKT